MLTATQSQKIGWEVWDCQPNFKMSHGLSRGTHVTYDMGMMWVCHMSLMCVCDVCHMSPAFFSSPDRLIERERDRETERERERRGGDGKMIYLIWASKTRQMEREEREWESFLKWDSKIRQRGGEREGKGERAVGNISVGEKAPGKSSGKRKTFFVRDVEWPQYIHVTSPWNIRPMAMWHTHVRPTLFGTVLQSKV